MSQPEKKNQLHLPTLSISGFRGIRALSIERLGRVTLLAGTNGVGKTTVLDAVQVYASRGRPSVIGELLKSRQEISTAINEKGEQEFVADLVALFNGRNVKGESYISVGPTQETSQLRIEETQLSADQTSKLAGKSIPGSSDYTRAFKVKFAHTEQTLPWVLPTYGSSVSRGIKDQSGSAYLYAQSLFDDGKSPKRMRCQPLGPGLLSNEEITKLWAGIALTDVEDRAVDALKWIVGSEVDRVAVIDEGAPKKEDRSKGGLQRVWEAVVGDVPTDEGHGRRVAIKLRGQSGRIPLNSLGDGALRLSGITLALANNQDGFLIIDEVENGFHHSLHREFWHMVLSSAEENNVQVLATTHSFDCMQGFAQALGDCSEIEGALVRIEKENGEHRAVEYSERNLQAASEHGIEVR